MGRSIRICAAVAFATSAALITCTGDETRGPDDGTGAGAGDGRMGDQQTGDAFGGDPATGGDERAGDPRTGDPRVGDPLSGDDDAGDTNGGDSTAGDSRGGDDRTGDDTRGDDNAGDSTPPITVCDDATYSTYFRQHPRLYAATIERLDATGVTAFCQAITELESTGRISISEPAASVSCLEPTSCPTIFLTADEVANTLAAKYAHAVWLDRNQLTPWRLEDYSDADLDGLFDPSTLMGNGNAFFLVVDYSPSDAYGYLTEHSLIGGSVPETIASIIDDLRTTDTVTSFIHGIAASGDPTNTAYTLYAALSTWDRGGTARISRSGCHSMTRIFIGLLRAANIPAFEEKVGNWYDNLHSSAVVPTMMWSLSHGDNMYSALLRATPSDELLTPFSFYEDIAHSDVCGTDRPCRGRRHIALNAVAYPAKYSMQRCCDPTTYGYADCRAYLEANVGPWLTTTELTDAAAAMEGQCN